MDAVATSGVTASAVTARAALVARHGSIEALLSSGEWPLQGSTSLAEGTMR